MTVFHFLFPLALVDNSDPFKLYLLLKELACHYLLTSWLAECEYSYLVDKFLDFQTRQFLSYRELCDCCSSIFFIALIF